MTSTSDFTPISGSNGLDLSSERDVFTYLKNTPYNSTDVIPLSGGTANYVFRLKLVAPFLGRETLVLKHAKPYVKDCHMIPLGLDRQIYEVKALHVVHKWLPSDSVVTVPEVHLFDEEHHVIIMDDAGEGSVTLKALMKQGQVSLHTAKEIGAAMGNFLGRLHKWGQEDKEACMAVRGNIQGRSIKAWAFYGRLRETLEGAEDVPLLSDPPLKIDEQELDIIDKVAKETTKAILTEEYKFVMGDFWPGNVMVSLDEMGALKHAHVLDWELSKTGLPGIDIGQFSAELHLLRRFHPEVCEQTATLVLEHFLREYRIVASPDEEDIRRANVHVGAHLVVLAGRVEWGEKERTREVVLEGARMIANGKNMLLASG